MINDSLKTFLKEVVKGSSKAGLSVATNKKNHTEKSTYSQNKYTHYIHFHPHF